MDKHKNKEWTFQRIEWLQHPKIPGKYITEWLLVISDLITLMSYMDYRSSGLMERYHKLKLKKKEGHCMHSDERMIEIFMLSHPERKTMVDDALLISDKFLSIYSKMFFTDGVVYVTFNNTVRPIATGEKTVLSEVTLKKLCWPTSNYTEQDIKINKWPMGKHYYAKIGDLDVEDELGNSKWNTAERAEEEAELFLKELQKGEEKINA